MTVTVYSKPNCIQCKATYRLFEQNNIDYDVVDIVETPEALDKIAEWGFYQAPVVVAGDEKWSGFRPDMIKKVASLVNA